MYSDIYMLNWYHESMDKDYQKAKAQLSSIYGTTVKEGNNAEVGTAEESNKDNSTGVDNDSQDAEMPGSELSEDMPDVQI